MTGKRAFRGHTPTKTSGAWKCTCGLSLSGGPRGDGRIGARDIMHFHRLDLWLAKLGVDAPEVTSV